MQTDRYRNFKLFKLIQMILLIVFGVSFFCYLKFDPLLRNNIYSNRNLLTICVFLWAFMIYSVVCLAADYKQLEKEILEAHKLHQTAYLDPLTGLPNRNGCDMMIGKYSLKRDVSSFGCALIELPKIDEINLKSGRHAGDKYIHDFAVMFESIGNRFGFLGRNSGNEFLLIIENCSAEKMQDFVSRLSEAVEGYNGRAPEHAMETELTYLLNEQEGLGSFIEIISKLYARERRG